MSQYFEAISLMERLHRQFLDILKLELDRRTILDINSVQAMILYNIGVDELTVGELTARGYYQGSNVSYNVKKMVENDYLIQERSVHDKRSLRVRLTPRGRELHDLVTDMFSRHEKHIAGSALNDDKLKTLNDTLRQVERFLNGRAHAAGTDKG